MLVAACLVGGCKTTAAPGATLNASTGDAGAADYDAILADRYDRIFPDDHVQTVRVLMSDDDWAEMKANIRAKEYYQADIWFDGELVQDVAIRTKGNSSLMSVAQASSFRAGLKVDFNFFNSARSYHGLKKVVFNNGFSDPTLMREFLGYELMAELGVAAPRACFVDLWVNDTHLGVYTEVEAVDGVFVSEHFRDDNGNLYKPELRAGRLDWTQADAEAQMVGNAAGGTTTTTQSYNVGGGDLRDIIERAGDDAGWIPGSLGSTTTTTGAGLGGGRVLPVGLGPGGDSSNYLVSMGLKTNEAEADYSRLYDLLEVLNTDPSEVSAQDLEQVVDVDEVLRFLAVSVALVHLDNYIGMGHNYYLYQNGSMFSIIPWDLNEVFGGFSSGLSEQKLLNFYIDEPTAASMSEYPLVEQLMDEPEFVERYHSYLQQIIDGPFSVEHMTTRIDEIADLIRPYVQKDENLLSTLDAFEQGLTRNVDPRGARMGGNFIGLMKFVRARTASIAAQLSGQQAAGLGDGSGNGGIIGVGGQGGVQGGAVRPGGAVIPGAVQQGVNPPAGGK
jgi:spore coat protein CotH